ncbi:M23 family metallopeptidase [Tsuneonella sp. CC-YZS046]|nr:M23 family metallopeptidase [Tsuneonella sp. CC-YZS046]WRO66017.1 M23 family metallopeptidase [Tsuneonella sp. CC-YZS046]
MKARSVMRGLAVGGASLILGACSAGYGDDAPAAGTAPRPPESAAVPPASPAPAAAVFSLSGELTQGGWVRGIAPAGTTRVTLDGAPLPLAPDRSFFAAFDRDAGRSAMLAAEFANGQRMEKPLSIAPRSWNIEHINAARRPDGPTEAFLAKRRPELARIEAGRAVNAASDGWRQRFIWPVKGRISGRFGLQRIYRGEPGAYHGGLDISTGASGTPFVAPADGVVVLAAQTPFTLEGYLLIVDHGAGLNSAFLHCSAILVREGERVKQGQTIGRIGATGRATGPHLHWGIKWRDARLDPLLFLPDPM